MRGHDAWRAFAAVAAVAAVTAIYMRVLHVQNTTTVALTLLLVVLVVAATSRLWIAVATSVTAMLAFNYFFLPPVGTLTIADPQNWVALFTFLAVSLVASNLSSVARARAREAMARRDEVARLFDLSRDVLLMTDSREAIVQLARSVARRFDLGYVAICQPGAAAWNVFEAGRLQLALDRNALASAYAGAENLLEFDARERTYSGHRTVQIGEHIVRLVPLRLGSRPIGILAALDRRVAPGTLDALAGVVAIAIERVAFLDERKVAEVARQSEELKSALLASLGHDLRTPLTAIRIAASNLKASWLTEQDRREQAEIVLTEIERLTRLFQNILEMARIDAGAVPSQRRWSDPSEIVEAARASVEHTLSDRTVDVQLPRGVSVNVDPRLTAGALSHLLENAAQHSSASSPIHIMASVTPNGLTLTVRDHGAGIAAADLPRLFDRFYRGDDAKQRGPGTGMGLSIARGLLAVEQGSVWAENAPDGGALFTITVPADVRETERPEAMA